MYTVINLLDYGVINVTLILSLMAKLIDQHETSATALRKA